MLLVLSRVIDNLIYISLHFDLNQSLRTLAFFRSFSLFWHYFDYFNLNFYILLLEMNSDSDQTTEEEGAVRKTKKPQHPTLTRDGNPRNIGIAIRIVEFLREG
jgi:hypothetical protein